MVSNIIHSGAALLLAWALWPAAARAEPPEQAVAIPKEPEPAVTEVRAAEPAHPFAAMAGAWAGGGTIALTGEIRETLRCRANYTYGQANSSLALSIRCAS